MIKSQIQNYVKEPQNQTDVQIRSTTSIHKYPYISTPIQSPSISINSNSTENSSDSCIQDILTKNKRSIIFLI